MFSLFILGHIKNVFFALLKNILITSQKRQTTMVSVMIREMLSEYFSFEVELKNISHEKDSKHFIMLSIDNKNRKKKCRAIH